MSNYNAPQTHIVPHTNLAVGTPSQGAGTGRTASGSQGGGMIQAQQHPQHSSSQANLLSQTRDGSQTTQIIEERIKHQNGEVSYRQYIKGKFLGKGGFAKCYEFVRCDNKEITAAKIILKSSLQRSRAKQKLMSEIKIHRSVKHVNVAQFMHFFEDSESVYILLELCHNQSMNELLKRRKRLHELEVKCYTMQIINALKYLHSHRIIHRDLKLGNLFLNDKMQIKLGDFGLATKLDFDGEKKRTICGTPNYIAPEVLEGRAGHSYEVDIWSLGVIIYTLIIGKPPFETTDVKATYTRIKRNQYSFPDHVPITDEARDLISRILTGDPSARPTLDQICLHPFMTNCQIPKVLPQSLLACPPSSQYIRQFIPQGGLGYQSTSTLPRRLEATAPADPVRSTNVRLNSGQRPGTSGPAAVFTDRGGVYSRQGANPQSNDPIKANKMPQITDQRLVQQQQMQSTVQQQQPQAPQQQQQIQQKQMQVVPPISIRSTSSKEIQQIPGSIGSSARQQIGQQPTKGNHDAQIQRPQTSGQSNATSQVMINNQTTQVWVTKWVDYSSKYGLGYLLSDMSAGVFFNDSTKIVAESTGSQFFYYERKAIAANEKQDVMSQYNFQNFPPELQKKVTLLQHFKSYLEQNYDPQEKDQLLQRNKLNQANKLQYPPGSVYVKKWMRTKHAIMFRLSNKIVQVNFQDHTEILLNSENRYVTYVNKKGERSTMPLNQALDSNNAEMTKRLKYTKDILTHMLNNNQQQIPGVNVQRSQNQLQDPTGGPLTNGSSQGQIQLNQNSSRRAMGGGPNPSNGANIMQGMPINGGPMQLDQINGGFSIPNTNSSSGQPNGNNVGGSSQASVGFQSMSSTQQQKRKISIGNRGAILNSNNLNGGSITQQQ